MGSVTFYYTCEAGGRVGAHKRLLRSTIDRKRIDVLKGLDGLETRTHA